MENRLREVIISITNRCNLRCKMCQIPETQMNGEMTTQQLKGLIIDAAKLSPNSIVFSGGEPLLREDLFELIYFTNQHKINTCLTSNGILIENGIAKELFSSGIGVVNVSIEGPEEIHDSLRGRGSFKKALKALENLFHYKIETTIATVVCRQNYPFLPFIFDLARQFGVTTIKLQPFNAIFLIKKSLSRDFFVAPGEAKEIKQHIDTAINLSKKYNISTNPENYLYSIPAYLCGMREISHNNGCAALYNSCPISADGNIYLCWKLSNKILGNVKKNELSKVWNSNKHNWQREKIIKRGCPGCLMSCYDYNFGKYNLKERISFKTRRLTKIGFYKKQYFSIHQNLKYILGKIINRLTNWNISSRRDGNEENEKLKEIKMAKNLLRNKLKAL